MENKKLTIQERAALAYPITNDTVLNMQLSVTHKQREGYIKGATDQQQEFIKLTEGRIKLFKDTDPVAFFDVIKELYNIISLSKAL